MNPRTELLQGSLDLLILKSLTPGAMHGWGISKRIRELSSSVLQINQGSLYPALYRLERKGWIAAEWGVSPEGRKIKLYTLTESGTEQLVSEREQWRLFAAAVDQVLDGA